jgi:hypothetical protein
VILAGADADPEEQRIPACTKADGHCIVNRFGRTRRGGLILELAVEPEAQATRETDQGSPFRRTSNP